MKKNEKFLALLLSVVMILTCFVGTVTVNAENATPTATIVVTADAVEVGATKIPVTLTVESEVGINEALIKVSSDLGDIIAQPTVVVNEGVGTAIADNAGNATDYNSFYLSAVSPDGQAETVMGEITKATITAVFVNEAGIAAGDYFVDVEIPEGKVIAASKDEVAIKLECTKLEIVVAEAVTEPVEIDANLLAHNLLLTESVGSRITVNVAAKNGLTTLGYTDYYMVIDYQLYDDSYNLTRDQITFKSSERNEEISTTKVDYFDFTRIALFEMPLEYDVYLYLYDANGDVTAYVKNTTSIRTQALNYANKYSTDTALLRTLADMVNYGAAAQNFFAASNAGTDICDAELPTVGFESFQTYASKATDLPATFNTTNTVKNPIKYVESSAFRGAATVLISSSTSIRFQFLAPGYDISKVHAVISYTDGYGDLVSETVNLSDITPTVSGSNTIYPHIFTKLALYDLEETVSVELYNDGVKEISFEYSAGNFVNQYIGNATYTEILTAMELFAQSAKLKLVG